MTYADANLLIYAVAQKEDPGDDARLILESAMKGEIELSTASLTFDEVMMALLRLKGRGHAYEITVRLVASMPSVLDVTAETINASLWIFKNITVRPRDAIHAALMIKHGIEEVITDDTDFDKIPGIKRVSISEFAKRLRKKK